MVRITYETGAMEGGIDMYTYPECIARIRENADARMYVENNQTLVYEIPNAHVEAIVKKLLEIAHERAITEIKLPRDPEKMYEMNEYYEVDTVAYIHILVHAILNKYVEVMM